jgi:catalase-peroxidase
VLRLQSGVTTTLKKPGFEWGINEESWGAQQWHLKVAGSGTVPDAHNPSNSHAPMMLTSDLALSGSYL